MSAMSAGKRQPYSEGNMNETRTKGRCYAVTYVRNASGKRERVYMHRMLMGVTDPNIIVEHINGNTLDNRIENLRVINPRCFTCDQDGE